MIGSPDSCRCTINAPMGTSPLMPACWACNKAKFIKCTCTDVSLVMSTCCSRDWRFVHGMKHRTEETNTTNKKRKHEGFLGDVMVGACTQRSHTRNLTVLPSLVKWISLLWYLYLPCDSSFCNGWRRIDFHVVKHLVLPINMCNVAGGPRRTCEDVTFFDYLTIMCHTHTNTLADSTQTGSQNC